MSIARLLVPRFAKVEMSESAPNEMGRTKQGCQKLEGTCSAAGRRAEATKTKRSATDVQYTQTQTCLPACSLQTVHTQQIQ